LFGDSFFLFNLIIYTVFIASFNLRNFYTLAQKKALETAQLNDQLSKAKLQALKMQINPHFLFNTLNVIQVLVMKKDITKATETLSLLSDFLRQTLDDSGEQWIPLKEELALIGQYLSIEQVRFGDRLAIHKNYSEDVMAISVPPMILQPLVENAVKHGLGEKQHKGTLTIQTQKVADKLVITLTDDGAGCDAEQAINDKQRIGLSNVIQRLQHLYDKQHLFDFKSVLGRGTTIKIELPLTLSKALND
jgi:sensor histidine kinase YesM